MQDISTKKRGKYNSKQNIIGAIALSYPPLFIDDSGAEFHADKNHIETWV